ncbi:hypothetical protein GCM10009787_16700 [Streptomyces bangladeshensis]|uniref:Uncharacterized protein n=1 Tax=Streptomyces bangladeshensis TaxID=295352 RepID=A0ABP5N5E1_9ACTN
MPGEVRDAGNISLFRFVGSPLAAEGLRFVAGAQDGLRAGPRAVDPVAGRCADRRSGGLEGSRQRRVGPAGEGP